MSLQRQLEGNILQLDPESGIPLPKTRMINYVTTSKADQAAVEGMTDFENGENILLLCDGKKQIEEIHFPRFISMEGNPLIFIQEEGDYIWTENRQYALRGKKKSIGLESFKDYLYLTSKSPNAPDKILIPFCIPSRDSIGQRSLQPLILIKNGDLPQEEWGVYTYFVYNVRQGEIHSLSLEGKLFLAYLRYSQKQYGEAIHLIKQIRPIDALSDVSIRILDLILSLLPSEDHPEAKMVHLFASSCFDSKYRKISSRRT